MQNENMSEREFRVSENASSPPRAGAGFKKSNPARSAIFFGGAHWEEDPERFLAEQL